MYNVNKQAISIHAPRTGSDNGIGQVAFAYCSFQSTLPARGATSMKWRGITMSNISIHAPRTGSDAIRAPGGSRDCDFNPRSPHGERLGISGASVTQLEFQSTLPARGATRGSGDWQNDHQGISIHAPRTGSDRWSSSPCAARCHFNPRSPHGERRGVPRMRRPAWNFNPRSPHGERPSCTCVMP